MNDPFEWASLLTAAKFNERPSLNERSRQTRKGAPIWKFAMSAEALIHIVYKNDETRGFFSQISLFFIIMKFINTFYNDF